MKNSKINGNTLKFIALVTMTIDHIGLALLNDYMPFRYIGRLAFPLFGYMLAEGCYYTHNKRKHFMGIFLLGLICQIVYLLAEGSVYQGILITFSLSILLIYSIEWAKKNKTQYIRWLLPLGMLGVCLFLTEGLPILLTGTDFDIDYGIWGILFPVLVYLSRIRWVQCLLGAAGLCMLSLSVGSWQWFSLFALIPIWFYNGEKGKWNTKYLFYIYYPLHLTLIYGISFFLV